jgi:predicted RNA-binding protein YlxR (DUF448 family)
MIRVNIDLTNHVLHCTVLHNRESESHLIRIQYSNPTTVVAVVHEQNSKPNFHALTKKILKNVNKKELCSEKRIVENY